MENNPFQQILADVGNLPILLFISVLEGKSPFVIPAKAKIKKLYAFTNRNSEDKL